MGGRKPTHGLRYTTEYHIWSGMKGRCLNPKNDRFASYGGAGVSIHPPWIAHFTAFLADVGPRPSMDHSLDRIDPRGNYEPGNVRWATRSEQQQNRRDQYRVVNGIERRTRDIANQAGLSKSAILSRIRAGYIGAQILSGPHQGMPREGVTKKPRKTFVVNGKTYTIAQLSAETGIKTSTIRNRLHRGKIEEGLTAPLHMGRANFV